MLKKQAAPPPEIAYPEDEVVLIEPAPGHSGEEILKLFERASAGVPQQLGPGFLSGNVPMHLREELHAIAAVHRKTTKRMH